jgi:FtsH-binding integral membrane protein
MGFVTGPGINMIAEVAPELLIQAALYSSAAFGSFSAVSLFSKRRSYLFLGGIIMTMMQVMCFYSLVGWLFSSGNMFGLGYLMCGLFIACLWIIFDT